MQYINLFSQRPLRGRSALRRAIPVLFFILGYLAFQQTDLLADSTPSPTESPSFEATPAFNPAGKTLADGTINLDATADRRLPNTVAEVTLAIQLDGKTADAVASALAQRSQTLIDYLRQQGVERLQTQDLSFEPQTESVHGAPDRIVGYRGHTFVSFRTTPDKVGTIAGGGLEHGANTIAQINFLPADNEIEAARRDLAIEATKSALDRAHEIAQAIGQRFVRIVNINIGPEEGVSPTTFRANKANTYSAAAPPIPTVAGEQQVSVRVSVQVAINRGSN